MAIQITSQQNEKIKQLSKLYEKSKERKEKGVFVVEGIKEIMHAMHNGYEIESLYYCKEKIDNIYLSSIYNKLSSNTLYYEVKQAVFEKIPYRETTISAIALAKPKQHDLKLLEKKANPLYLVLDGVEKPGNIGAILRTADAAALDAVIICDAATDVYNPNVIRASLGCVFTVPIAICHSEEALDFLQKNDVTIFTTYLEASIPYTSANFKQACAVVVGSEAQGVSQLWVDKAKQNIIIPMRGSNDSLNVSATAAIVVFEALRQRMGSQI